MDDLDTMNHHAFRTDRFEVDRGAAGGEDENTDHAGNRDSDIFPGIAFPGLGELIHKTNLGYCRLRLKR